MEDTGNSILNEDEIKQLQKISWEDAEAELIKNKEMIRSDGSTVKREPEIDAKKDASQLDFIMDLPLRFTVEVGRKRLTIEELLSYKVGSIVELEKKVGIPMNLLVNDVQIGEGIIVVQNQRFCTKITKLYDHIDKMSVISA